MPEGTPTGAAFGIRDPAPSQDGDPFADTPEVPDASQPGSPAEKEPWRPRRIADQPEGVAPEPQGTPESQEGATTAPEAAQGQPEPFRFADRDFATQDAAAESYKNMQRQSTRAVQEARAAAEERDQLRQYLTQALPYLQQMGAVPPATPFAGQPQWPAQGAPFAGTPPQAPSQVPPELAHLAPEEQQQLMQLIGPIVDQRVNAVRQEFNQQAATFQQNYQTEFETRRQQQEAQGAIASFQEAHPDIPEGSPEEWAVADVMRTYGLPMQPQALEAALEISRNPSLARAIKASPIRAFSEEGMAEARMLSSLPGAQAQAVSQATAEQQMAADAARTAAFVETGGSGAPITQAPGTQPRDEFDEGVAELKGKRGRSAFGV